MSRCFPYIPSTPSCQGQGNHDEIKKKVVLISSIADEAHHLIESEREKAHKESRREKKREKKEKKREKKEKKEKKKKEKSIVGEDEKKEGSRKEKGGDLADKDHLRNGEHDLEYREKSNLTEEHEQPATVPKLYDSSDSTQNSCRRKKQSLLSEGGQNQSTMLRIRLPLQKHKDMEVLPSKEQPLPSRTEIISQKMVDIAPGPSNQQLRISGTTEMITQKMVDITPRPVKGKTRPISGRSGSITKADIALRTCKEQPHPISGRTESNIQKNCKVQSHPISGRTEVNTQEVADLVQARFSKEQARPLFVRTGMNTQRMIDTAPRVVKEQPGSISGRNDMVAQKVDIALISKGQPCPISARTGINTQEMADITPSTCKDQSRHNSGRTEVITQKIDIAPRPSIDHSCSTSGRTEVQAPEPTAAGSSRSTKSRRCDVESQLRHLIENWVPPSIQVERDDLDDQEWLFDVPRDSKRLKASDGSPCLSSSLWPRATYLPEIDMYALPYTVPY